AEFFGEPRMHLDARLRILVNERADPSSLRAGKELAHDAARCEHYWILFISVFCGRRVVSDVETRFSIREVKRPLAARYGVPASFFEQSRRAGMVFARTGPEDPVLLF